MSSKRGSGAAPTRTDDDRPFSDDAIARLAAGEVAAFAECFRAFGRPVWRIARSLLGQAADADDAVQEIFLRVRAKAAQFDGRGAFAGWLRQLAVRHCLNVLAERRRRDARVAPTKLDELTVAPSVALDDRDEIERLLARLPEPFRTTLLLREQGGLSYREIAEQLALPIGTVMSRLARARERLIAMRSEVTTAERTAARGADDGRG